MIPLYIYALKVILISGCLFGYYYLALRNERFHEWNRYYLVVSALISLILPFVKWSALFPGYGSSKRIYVAELRAFSVPPSGHFTPSSGWDWMAWTGAFYALISLILLISITAGIIRIRKRIRQGEKKRFPVFTLVRHPRIENPFSFFRFIFWTDLYSIETPEGNHIFLHELAHVKEKHSIDKLLMETIVALFWINPFFHLMRKELHMIHEFIADHHACSHSPTENAGSFSPEDYATLLVKQCLRSGHFRLTNHFFQKQLTRRVRMIIRENTSHFTYIRRLAAIPVTLALALFFIFIQSQAKSEPSVSNGKEKQTLQKNAGLTVPVQPLKKVFTFVEHMPQFPGGESALMNYLHNHIHYPRAARENGIQGTVVVQFIVNADGQLTDVTTVGVKKGGGLETEAIHVVKEMPKWIPGKQNRETVAVRYALPVRFVLENTPSNTVINQNPSEPFPPQPLSPSPQTETSKIPSGKVFTLVEQMPTFPGGTKGIMDYLHDHIHYPAAARENGIQGTVVIQFIIGTDGHLSDVHALGKERGGGLEEEAIRVIKSMPDWNPGMQNGQDVAVQYSMPVRFVLQ